MGVAYVPRQPSEDARSTSSRAAIRSPIRLLVTDIYIFLRNLHFLPNTVLPRRQLSALRGIQDDPQWLNTRDTALLVFISIVEFLLLIVSAPVFLFLPGWLSLLIHLSVILLAWICEQPMWGSTISVHSTVELPKTDIQKFAREKWLFLNGIGTSHRSLQTTCNRLSATFRRPITGIHNRSYGLVFDIFECLLQRCFAYSSLDVRTAFEYLKIQLLNPNVDKVVVIAHSQGGILISLAMDGIFAELPAEAISKMEIYTFGSAASQFNNPLNRPVDFDFNLHAGSPQGSPKPELIIDPEDHLFPTIRTIEHYANEMDLVPRWGVLYNTGILQPQTPTTTSALPRPPTPESPPTSPTSETPIRQHQKPKAPKHQPWWRRVLPFLRTQPATGPQSRANTLLSASSPTHVQRYAGRVFINSDASGHLFNEHYLDVMFPLNDDGTAVRPGGFLDQVVDVKEAPGLLVGEPGQVAIDDMDGCRHNRSPSRGTSRSPDAIVRSRRRSESGITRGLEEGRGKEIDGNGKVVRELSKLWKYVGGGTA